MSQSTRTLSRHLMQFRKEALYRGLTRPQMAQALRCYRAVADRCIVTATLSCPAMRASLIDFA
jgi:hypothetical protein